jgi:multidrug resistance protein MdtO
MAARSDVLPANAPSTVDHAGVWFWNFLKAELSPYPGRAWVVSRMTISATLVMLWVMTFNIPGGFQGAIFTLLISRENPRETFFSGLRTAGAYMIGTAYTVLTIRMLVDDPLTHFLWIAGSIFIFFYLLRILVDYAMGAACGFALLGSISLWDNNTVNVNTRLEQTLWLMGGVVLAVVVTIVVEYVFRRVHPTSDLTEGIEIRMQVVEHVLRSAATGQPLESEWEKRLSTDVSVGISRLRRLILRSESSPHYKAQMATTISLVGRLIDIAASFRLALAERARPIDPADQSRCLRLADQIAMLSGSLRLRQLPAEVAIPPQEEPSNLPFLSTMEQNVALIPGVFAGSQSVQVFNPGPLEEEEPARIFVPDSFSNPAYVGFALRGTLAAMACYIAYTAVDWPGLSTSVLTCYITALSTIGSSRQKQVLRLAGAAIGGFVFGMGAEIFVLPYLDTIAGFTVLFAFVTAISAWIQTASARLSYLGVQLALAFYLINLQDFAIQTSLSIPRDRVFGVLLGLMSMGLFYDLLWVRNPAAEMQAVFSRNLEMFAELTEQLLEKDQTKAIKRIRQLRDQLNAGFLAVGAQGDAVLLDFSHFRQQGLQIRDEFRRWQPPLRTLLMVQVTSVQYLVQKPLTGLPEPIAQAGVAFEEDMAKVMRAMANEVSGKPAAAVPDIRAAAARFREEIDKHYRDAGTPVPPQASDVMDLVQSLASIVAPLYDDIHSTCVARPSTAGVPSRSLQAGT